MTKTVRFVDVPHMAAFVIDEQVAEYLHTPNREWVKVSPRKAAPQVNGRLLTSKTLHISGSVMVQVDEPDPVPPTTEELQKERVRRFWNRLTDFELQGRQVFEQFSEQFETNPLYAFEWSDNAITAAARRDVAAQLRAFVESNTDPVESAIDRAIAEARQQALRGARWPKMSTSPISNFVAQQRVAAYAEFVDGF